MNMKTTEPENAVIAVENGKLAIFGSRMGFLGPVIQNYTPFDDETTAIAEARDKLAKMGIPVEEEISRPRITSLRATYVKSKRK